jgi:hypothetical protein
MNKKVITQTANVATAFQSNEAGSSVTQSRRKGSVVPLTKPSLPFSRQAQRASAARSQTMRSVFQRIEKKSALRSFSGIRGDSLRPKLPSSLLLLRHPLVLALSYSPCHTRLVILALSYVKPGALFTSYLVSWRVKLDVSTVPF